jgi:hypothetical protein
VRPQRALVGTVCVLVAVVAVAACGGSSSSKSSSSSASVASASAATTAPPAAAPATNAPAATTPTTTGGGSSSGGGTLVVSGAFNASLAEQPASAGSTYCGPGSTNGVDGQVYFGSGSSAYLLVFTGGPGTFQLPLASGPSVLLAAQQGPARWGGLKAPSSGHFAITGSQPGSIHGSIDATLANLLTTSAGSICVSGSWVC